jgi:general stress protein 26
MSILLGLSAQAQKVSGSWYGKAEVMLQSENHNYLTELILTQKGNTVSGVMGYYFKDQYQSFFIKGTYDPKSRLLLIKRVPVVYFRSNDAKPSVNCVMDFEATLTVSRVKSTLKGYYLRDKNYMYTCPDLNLTFTLDTKENTDAVLREAVAVQRVWRPTRDELVVSADVLEEKKAIIGTPEIKAFEARKTVVNNEILVSSDSLRVTLYDNGTVDGDTISVFYNNIPVVAHQGLNVQGANFYLKLDSAMEVHELSMFAENLGRIPPNTALMIIHDGIQRHEIFLTSTLNSNGTVRIRKKAGNKSVTQ